MLLEVAELIVTEIVGVVWAVCWKFMERAQLVVVDVLAFDESKGTAVNESLSKKLKGSTSGLTTLLSFKMEDFT